MNNITFPQLHKITSLIKFLFEADEYAVRGIKDSPAKILACYFALKYTGHTKREISKFFQIHPCFMENEVEDLKIQFALHPEKYVQIERVEQLYQELEIADLF